MHTRDPHGGQRSDWSSGHGAPTGPDDPFDAAVRRDPRAPQGHGARHSAQWSNSDAGFIGLVSDDAPMIAANAAPPRGQGRAPAQPSPAVSDPFAGTTPLRREGPMDIDPFSSAPVQPLLGDGPSPREADQPVPRIKIHAACDRRDVARAVQASASDRRMAKAQISIEMGGIEAALARLSNEPSPDLLILDTAVHGGELLRALERLAEVVEPKCKVMIVGGSNDIALYRRLMQLGISEYLVAPLEPVQLIRSIGDLYADPDKPFAGRVSAFLGARGGVGASTLAHNVAWSISEQQGSNVTLVDLDLPFGTAALDFNQEPQQTIQEALAAADKVDEMFLDRVVSRPTDRLMLFSAPARLEKAFDMDPSAVSTVLEKVRRTGPNVVLDLPHGWTSWMSQTVLSADDIIIVASPDLSSLRNTKNLVEFAARQRPNDSPPLIVLNMVGVPKRPEISAKDFGDHVGAPVVAEVPFEPALFGAAANNGEMLMEQGAASKPGAVIAALASRLTGRAIQAPKRAGLLDKIGLNRR
jgi:pilus assembly protein CpaE